MKEVKDLEENKSCVKKGASPKQPADGGIMIPKSRFDEVNGRYKEAAAYARKLEEVIRAMNGEISDLESRLEELRSVYDSEKTLLELKGIFVDAGFSKEEYDGIVTRISCPTREEKIALAEEIVKLRKREKI